MASQFSRIPGLSVSRCLIVLIACLLAATANAEPADPVSASPPASISGSLRLLDADGEPLEDPTEFRLALVYFEPDGGLGPAAEPALATMTTLRRQFAPRVLPIRVGDSVVFPNEDPILHNVFSSSPGNVFDLGLYGESPGKTVRFDQAGLVRVFCNVHGTMSAHIVVIDSDHFATPDRDGRFRLDQIAPASGRLTIWHERAEARQLDLQLESGETELGVLELKLTVRQLGPGRDRLRRPARRGRY